MIVIKKKLSGRADEPNSHIAASCCLSASTAIVWCRMYYTRITEICRRRISVQDLAQAVEAKRLLKGVAGPSDNLVNLFEDLWFCSTLPLIIYVLHFSNGLYLGLAWAFVLLRYAHSLIHVTYNRVMHCFTVYFAGTLSLWVIWAILGGELVMKAMK